MAAFSLTKAWCTCSTIAASGQAQVPDSRAAGARFVIQSFRNQRGTSIHEGAYCFKQRKGRLGMVQASMGGREVSEPTAKDLEAIQEMDKLIDTLVDTDDRKLPQVVAKNVMAFSPKFWLRMAMRTDQCKTADDKEDLIELANKCMQIVDRIAKKSQEKIDDNALVLESILEAVADPDTGAWKVPMTREDVAKMRKELESRQEFLDDTFLASVSAYMRKCKESNLENMTVLLQRILQVYCAWFLTKHPKGRFKKDEAKRTREESVLERLIGAEEEDWDPILREELVYGGATVDQEKLFSAILRRLERSVLYLENGSYQQRIVVEYLKEIENRATAVLEASKAGPPVIQLDS